MNTLNPEFYGTTTDLRAARHEGLSHETSNSPGTGEVLGKHPNASPTLHAWHPQGGLAASTTCRVMV